MCIMAASWLVISLRSPPAARKSSMENSSYWAFFSCSRFGFGGGGGRGNRVWKVRYKFRFGIGSLLRNFEVVSLGVMTPKELFKILLSLTWLIFDWLNYLKDNRINKKYLNKRRVCVFFLRLSVRVHFF